MPDAPLSGRQLALSMGEPAGVGPDIILLAHARLQSDPDVPQLVVFGDPALLQSRAKRLGVDVPFSVLGSMDDLHEGHHKGLTVIDVGRVEDKPGLLDEDTANLTLSALGAALDAVRRGNCSGLVTAPIHKANLYATGFAFPGHTEFLEAYAQEHWPERDPLAVMMLAGPELRTVPVTVHIPLSDVAGSLSMQRIVEVGAVVARDLKQRFGIDDPRLSIAGLNPHAGEQGSLGKEDDAIIAPAITRLGQMGIKAIGPLPADTMFHPEARQAFDAALCMYHDQALIPVKALDFHNTVNVTLGLPFVRTSPDHGTALSLAGTGGASPASMIAAIKLAAKMAERARETA